MKTNQYSPTRFLRVKEVSQILGMGISTVWRKAKCEPNFPRPVKVSPRITAWLDTDIANWVQSHFPKGEEK